MSDLRELVEQWRVYSQRLDEVGNIDAARSHKKCADELEETLDENVDRRPNAKVHYGVTDDD